jgi:hypothetical protein
MANVSTLMALQARISADPKVTVWHISLYTCLLNLWFASSFPHQIKITRKRVMSQAHFRSITTYHKCISELVELGYISYTPTYDTYQGSTVEILTKIIGVPSCSVVALSKH